MHLGSVSPPTAPLLFITTSIAQATFSETNRHVWWFMLAETLVLLLVIFVPGPPRLRYFKADLSPSVGERGIKRRCRRRSRSSPISK